MADSTRIGSWPLQLARERTISSICHDAHLKFHVRGPLREKVGKPGEMGFPEGSPREKKMHSFNENDLCQLCFISRVYFEAFGVKCLKEKQTMWVATIWHQGYQTTSTVTSYIGATKQEAINKARGSLLTAPAGRILLSEITEEFTQPVPSWETKPFKGL